MAWTNKKDDQHSIITMMCWLLESSPRTEQFPLLSTELRQSRRKRKKRQFDTTVSTKRMHPCCNATVDHILAQPLVGSIRRHSWWSRVTTPAEKHTQREDATPSRTAILNWARRKQTLDTATAIAHPKPRTKAWRWHFQGRRSSGRALTKDNCDWIPLPRQQKEQR